jgi:hypothetical protein
MTGRDAGLTADDAVQLDVRVVGGEQVLSEAPTLLFFLLGLFDGVGRLSLAFQVLGEIFL